MTTPTPSGPTAHDHVGEPDEVLDAAGVCRLLGISRPTLDALVEAGKAPPSRDLGTGSRPHRRWSRAAVLAWLAAGGAR